MDPVTAPSPRRPVGARDARFEFAPVIADSAVMRHTIQTAHRVAGTPVRALMLFGEAGAGKDLLARCIHNAGAGANDPFIAINCASIPSADAGDGALRLRPRAPRRPSSRRSAGTGRAWHRVPRRDRRPCRSRCRTGCCARSRSTAFRDSARPRPMKLPSTAASSPRQDRGSRTTLPQVLFRDDLLATSRRASHRAAAAPRARRRRAADRRSLPVAESTRPRRRRAARLGLDAARRAPRAPLARQRPRAEARHRTRAIGANGPLIGAEHLMINQRRAGAGAIRGAVTLRRDSHPGRRQASARHRARSARAHAAADGLQPERRGANPLHLAADAGQKAQGLSDEGRAGEVRDLDADSGREI